MTTVNCNLWLNFICRCLGVNLTNCKYESGELSNFVIKKRVAFVSKYIKNVTK